VNFRRFGLGTGFAVLFALVTVTAGFAQSGPAPAAPGAAAPVATSTPAGPRRGKRAPAPNASGSPGAEPSDTPEPPQFTTLDGVWEVEMQPLGKKLATYSHFNITSTGADLTGYWMTGGKNTKYPLTGNFDGRLISISIKMPGDKLTTFSGYVETFGDMVGLQRTSDTDPGTAFTAQHRKKLKGSPD
jgi:hypothetical protein